MKDFAYIKPRDLNEAVERGRASESRFIAGGTLLVDLLRLNVE